MVFTQSEWLKFEVDDLQRDHHGRMPYIKAPCGTYFAPAEQLYNTFDNWRKRVPAEDKQEVICEYVLANQDSTVVEERWRTKINKRLCSLNEQLTSELRGQRRAIETELRDQRRSIEMELREQRRAMEGMKSVLAQTALNAEKTQAALDDALTMDNNSDEGSWSWA